MGSDLAARLGFGGEARLLIVNCDDLGSSHAANLATHRALSEGIATNATLMVPCPGRRRRCGSAAASRSACSPSSAALRTDDARALVDPDLAALADARGVRRIGFLALRDAQRRPR